MPALWKQLFPRSFLFSFFFFVFSSRGRDTCERDLSSASDMKGNWRVRRGKEKKHKNAFFSTLCCQQTFNGQRERAAPLGMSKWNKLLCFALSPKCFRFPLQGNFQVPLKTLFCTIGLNGSAATIHRCVSFGKLPSKQPENRMINVLVLRVGKIIQKMFISLSQLTNTPTRKVYHALVNSLFHSNTRLKFRLLIMVCYWIKTRKDVSFVEYHPKNVGRLNVNTFKRSKKTYFKNANCAPAVCAIKTKSCRSITKIPIRHDSVIYFFPQKLATREWNSVNEKEQSTWIYGTRNRWLFKASFRNNNRRRVGPEKAYHNYIFVRFSSRVAARLIRGYWLSKKVMNSNECEQLFRWKPSSCWSTQID